jgi:UDP-N-acetyl-2-amino-2-deoxyglucuronate dehydrogenase
LKNFVLIGVAGYIAPKHLKAIKETGNNLLAALDKNDSVGILDSFFPNCDFFTEFERFDRHCEKLKRNGIAIDYVVVCSPNYLHDSHIRFGLRLGADVICEKPVVLNPWNVDALMEMEKETGKSVYTILQLRLHPTIIALQKKLSIGKSTDKHLVDLQYITSRGKWYQYSWKGDSIKSGGIATNIGLHFFDMLILLFGKNPTIQIEDKSEKTIVGKFTFNQAEVNWKLSIDYNELPTNVLNAKKTTFRQLILNGEEVEFSDGFTDLHTLSYTQIIQGNGIGLLEALQSIELAYKIKEFKN